MNIKLDPAVGRDVIARTAKFEGGRDGFSSINANSDNSGLSFGLINWSQRGGGLYELLAGMYTMAPAAFGRVFGPGYRTLLQRAREKSLEPVEGALLWEEPWLSRFRSAALDPDLRKVQTDLALYGSYMQAASDAMVTMGLRSERALGVVFDRAVQQGPGRTRRIAQAVAQEASTLPTERQRLERFIALITPHAGRWAADAKRRADALLTDPSITDRPAITVSA